MPERNGRILVVDDDRGVLTAAKLLLKRHFAVVQTEADPERIPQLLASGFDVVLLDMNFAAGADTGAEGLRWLERIIEVDPAAVVILMTAYGDVATAVSAIKTGATDFVLKPWQNEKLIATVRAGLELRQSRLEVERLRQRTRELARDGLRRHAHHRRLGRDGTGSRARAARGAHRRSIPRSARARASA